MRLKHIFFALLVFNISMINAQNFVVSSMHNPKCFNDCDGTITFTSGVVTGPFTMVMTNTSSCPNSTVQNSTMNSITVNSICGCPGTYTFTIYNPGMAVVGTMVQQFINYSTGPLTINTNTMTQATCSNCCDGDVTFTITGGSQQASPTYSVDGTFTTNINPVYFLCVGQHTVCVHDASDCVACKVFNMSYTGAPTGIDENSGTNSMVVYPNPANDALYISGGNSVSKLEIFDLNGRKVLSPQLPETNGNLLKVNLTDLNSGLYYILAYNSENRVVLRQKFAKNPQ